MENIFIPGMPGNATPQQKILAVTRSLGIRDTDLMQPTTRNIYDTLPRDGRTVFNFFQGCNNRDYPLTNLSQNKMEVGEAMISHKITFTSVAAAAGIYTPEQSMLNLGGGYSQSLLNVSVANSIVLKDFQVLNMAPTFNQYSNYEDHAPYFLSTLLTLPSLQEFIFTLKITDPAPVADAYLKINVEGVGILYKTYGSL